MWIMALSLSSLTLLSACGDETDQEVFVGNWKWMPDFSGLSRYGAASFVLNDQAYIVSGYNSNEKLYLKDCYRFDANANRWEKMADFPGDGRISAFGFAAGGKGYVGCGWNSSTNVRYNDVYEYDPTTNTWAQVENFANDTIMATDSTKAATGRYGSVSFDINGIGYVAGGYGQSYLNEVWAYDPSQPVGSRWSAKADLPRKCYYAQAFVINGLAYVLGGNNNGSRPTSFYAYNPSSNSWERKRDITNATDDDFDNNYSSIAREAGCTFVIGGLGYITLGESSSSLSTTWEYDPAQDLWTRKADFEGSVRSHGVGFSINGRGFITTGRASSASYDDTWEFKPFEDKIIGD